MKLIIYECDRCNMKIDRNSDLYRISPGLVDQKTERLQDYQPDELRAYEELHLCRACLMDILLFTDRKSRERESEAESGGRTGTA